MAYYWLHQNETSITIPKTEEVNAITYYEIVVNVGGVCWSVKHRYSEFYELHNQVVIDHGVAKDLIPPKKVIRNKCPIFIESRRQALEEYIQHLQTYLKRTMPRVFLEFLHLHHYDIYFLLQSMALFMFEKGDTILSSIQPHTFNMLELHSISECIKTPCPECEQHEKRFDLSHVLDFTSQLKYLEIQGQDTAYLTTNIIPNNLLIDFTSFRALEMLSVVEYNLSNVSSLGSIRNTLKCLDVHKSSIQSISQILQCDIIHKCNLDDKQVWNLINILDLSGNEISTIDETIKLVPNVEKLILNYNKITTIGDLSSLTKLKHLELSNNLIVHCEQLHTKLGNIKWLNLSQNFLSTLDGLSKLYSIETLDLNSNKITNVDSVCCLADLPCIENLILTGNSVSTTIDYRVKVFELFGDRAKDICLDNEKATQSEIDKALVLRALRIVKEGRKPNFSSNHN